jgi:transposase-like protein
MPFFRRPSFRLALSIPFAIRWISPPGRIAKSVAQASPAVYRAADATAGQADLDAFAQGPTDAKYPAIAQSWRRNWELVISFFACPEGLQRIIY